MAKIDLLDLEIDEVVGTLEGQKIIFTGSNDLGKSTVMSKMPKSLMIMCEAGSNALRCHKLQIDKDSQFVDLVNQLTKEATLEKMKEKYQTICIDNTPNLVAMFEQGICNQYGVSDLSEVQKNNDNPNGYLLARKKFNTQISKLCNQGYTVIFSFHEETIKQTDPFTQEEYLFTIPKGTGNTKSSLRMIRDICDFCFTLVPTDPEPETLIPNLSKAICKRTRNHFARARYDIQPVINPFTAENVQKAILEAIEKTANNQGGEAVAPRKMAEYNLQDLQEMIKPIMEKLWENNAKEVLAIVESQLGEKRLVSSATEEEILSLETIYTNLMDLADTRNIKI